MSEASTGAGEVDPDDLQAQLDEIKTAMGLEERYPGQGRVWLAYGGIVGGLSLALQFLFVVPLPEWGYQATWVAFAAVGVGSLYLLARWSRSGDVASATPDWGVLVASLAAFLFALQAVASPITLASDLPGVATGAFYFATVIAVGGLGFLFVGNALAAHRIRRRDRLVFYAGGAWMLAFAGAFTNVEWLHYFGYGTFAVLTVVQSLVSYWLLARG